MEKISNKQFLLITIVYFIIAYIILWFLGGACTSFFVAPSQEATMCLSKTVISGLSAVPILGLFLPFTAWVSLMYWFAPIAGFVFAYFIIGWWNDYFKTQQATTIIFPILLIVILLVGYLINLSWYYGEFAAISSNRNPGVDVSLYFCFQPTTTQCNEVVNKLNTELQQQAISNNSKGLSQVLGVNFFSELRESFFLTFILGGLAAWKLLWFKRILQQKEQEN